MARLDCQLQDRYKRTPVGLIPIDWSIANGFITINSGYGFKLDEYSEEGVPLIRINNVKHSQMDYSDLVKLPFSYIQEYKEFVLKRNDILMALNRPITQGNLKISKLDIEPAILYQRVGKLVFDEGYNPEFYYHYLKSHMFVNKLEINLVGSDQPYIKNNEFYRMYFPVPPIIEQSKIAEILSTWDKAIELKERLIDEKKKQKTGLMQKLLTGKVRLPSFIGEWKEVKLGKVIREINDKTTENNQYQVLTSSRQGIFLQEEYFNKSVASSNNIGYKIIKKGQFTYRTMSDDGSFKFNRLMEYEEGIVSPAYVVFETTKINPVFLMNLMNDYSFNKHIQKETQGGTRLSLKYNSLKEFVIKIPSIEEQDAIANVLNTVDKVIELNQKELEEIKLQKKGLMQLLLTGIVRVYSQEN